MAEEDVTNNEQAPQADPVAGADAQAANAQAANAQQFTMQRAYIKDLSFESPGAPGVFKQEWKPQMNVDLRTRSAVIDADNYEVLLTLTVTAKINDATAFLIEVQQAGIFLVRGIEAENLRRILGVVCPTMLFPYAREAIDSIVVKGTYPALMLAQINFDALYQQALEQSQQQAAAGEGAAEEVASS